MILALCFALSIALPGYASEVDSVPENSPAPEGAEVFQPEPEPANETPEEIPDAAPEEAPDETPDAAPEETPEEIPDETSEANPDEPGNPDETADGNSVIQVSVPETGWIILNPYGMPVDAGAGISTEQIVGAPLAIINQGETAVTVSASAVGRVSGGGVFVSTPPREDAREKEIFLYAEFKDDESPWDSGYTDAENQLLITQQLSEPKDVLTLNNEETGWFQLFGSTAVYPDQDWCSDDVIHVSITFTFTSEDDVDNEPETDAEDPEDAENPEASAEPDESVTDPEAPDGPVTDPEAPDEPVTDPEEPDGPVTNPEEPDGPGDTQAPEEPGDAGDLEDSTQPPGNPEPAPEED